MGQGYFPFFGQFATSILAEDEIGGSAFERRDFIVYAYRAGTSSPIQSTLITIYTLAGPAQGEMAPIVINDVIPISNGNTVTPLLTGTFPVNQSMFYWVGVPGSDGAFETVASCVSTDGFFAACASIGQDIPYRFAGDVVLMTSDGSYSTRSPVGFRF